MKNVLRDYNKPISYWTNLVNEWIFNEMHRNIFKDYYFNGIPPAELERKYPRTERQIWAILDKCMKEILKHVE